MFEMKKGYELKEKVSPCKQFIIHYVEFNSEIVGKRCTKCLEIKELNRFGKRSDSATLGGVVSQCKDCKNTRSRDYFQENIEVIHEKHKKYRDENKEKEKERGIRYRCENPEKLKKYREENRESAMFRSRQWYLENKEYANAFNRGYYRLNKKNILLNRKKWYYSNKEHVLAIVKRWSVNNPEKVKAISYKRRTLKFLLPTTLTPEQVELLMELQENKCILSSDTENLHLEHFIPLSWATGGTTFENCYYLQGKLNISKGNRNPFEWIKTQPVQHQQNFHYVLIPMLAERNGMSVSEFTAYIFQCEQAYLNNKEAEKEI